MTHRRRQKALQAINMDNDGYIDWNEFLVYLKWAMRQYPNIKDVDELLSCAFNKGIIPAMRDEVLGKKGRQVGERSSSPNEK